MGLRQEFFASQAATQAAGLFTSKPAEIPEVRGGLGPGIWWLIVEFWWVFPGNVKLTQVLGDQTIQIHGEFEGFPLYI